MQRTKILVADNDPDHLKIMRDFLKRKGYSVVVARNVPQAKQVLEQGGVDLAILDVRLTRDNDRRDISGLTLATLAPLIPKIVLTRYPTYETVRVALRSVGSRRAVAIDFVSKPQGLQAIQRAVESAVSNAIQRTEYREFFDHLQNGNREAWKQLWDEEAWRLITLVRRHGFSSGVAKDICFQVFREVAQARRPPRGGLKAALVNETLQKIQNLALRSVGEEGHRRRVAMRKSAQSPVSEKLRVDIVAPAVNDRVSNEKLINKIKEAVNDLPEREQRAIVMHLFEEDSVVDIAKALRVTSKTVNRYLRSASAHLENKLAELE